MSIMISMYRITMIYWSKSITNIHQDTIAVDISKYLAMVDCLNLFISDLQKILMSMCDNTPEAMNMSAGKK